jgi:hypothetical protein
MIIERKNIMGNKSSMIINELCEMDMETTRVPSKVFGTYGDSGGLEAIDEDSEIRAKRDMSVTKEVTIDVALTLDAISVIRRFAEVIKEGVLFKEVVEDNDPLEITGLDGIFEQKLGMYIMSSILVGRSDIRSFMAYPNDIIRGINTLFSDILNIGYSTFLEEDLLDGYPIALLTKISGASRFHVNIIGESVRRIIEIRRSQPKWLPSELNNVMIGAVPLVGDKNSPLTERELDAVYRYLGVRKTLYVNILLNTLFELRQHENRLNRMMTEEELCDVCRSTWVYLLQIASVQNVCDDLAHINSLDH